LENPFLAPNKRFINSINQTIAKIENTRQMPQNSQAFCLAGKYAHRSSDWD
jgi:hypothetical protein